MRKLPNYKFVAPNPISIGFCGTAVTRDVFPAIMKAGDAKRVTSHADIFGDFSSLRNGFVKIEAQLWLNKDAEKQIKPEIRYNCWVNSRNHEFTWKEAGRVKNTCLANWNNENWQAEFENDMCRVLESVCNERGLDCTSPIY